MCIARCTLPRVSDRFRLGCYACRTVADSVTRWPTLNGSNAPVRSVASSVARIVHRRTEWEPSARTRLEVVAQIPKPPQLHKNPAVELVTVCLLHRDVA